MVRDPSHYSRRLSFLSLIAWVSLCLMIAGWFPQLGLTLGKLWICVGLFGLVSAVGMSASVKTEMRLQREMLDTYICEARTDALTGLANRRAFEQELEAKNANRKKGSPLSLLFIDVDHFKDFNDRHGHRAGDETLRGVARVLQNVLPGPGLVTRYGGEEFAVILPDTGEHQAKLVAERVRRAVADRQFRFRDQELHVTVSVGVAEALVDETPDELVNRADTSLYAAKESGRNCTFYHDGTSCQPLESDVAAESLLCASLGG